MKKKQFNFKNIKGMLTNLEMKQIRGGSGYGGGCESYDCGKDISGNRKTCPSGCRCESAEGNPCVA